MKRACNTMNTPETKEIPFCPAFCLLFVTVAGGKGGSISHGPPRSACPTFPEMVFFQVLTAALPSHLF